MPGCHIVFTERDWGHYSHLQLNIIFPHSESGKDDNLNINACWEVGTNRKLEKFLYAYRCIQSDSQTDCRFLPLLKVRCRFSYVQYKLPGIWLEVEHDLNAFYSSNLFFLFVYVTILEPVALRSALRYINVIQTLALRIGPFWDASNLCFKVSAKPFIWKWFFILMQVKLTSIRKWELS